MSDPVLSVRDLRTYFNTPQGVARAVDGVSFEVRPGETLAIVGESGCGKSVTSLSIMGLLPRPAAFHPGGEIWFQGRDLLTLKDRDLRRLRGAEMAMIFQEPMTSLNPIYRVGAQVGEVLRQHKRISRAEARAAAIELLDQVGISDPARRVDDYPHQLSGGMKQRVMIAMALAMNPRLLIADEPTTALDVTVQAQILDLLKRLQRERDMGVVLITHDLGVVAEVADRVVVMYAGKVVESANAAELFERPRHPYTLGLFRSLPHLDGERGRLDTIPGMVPRATQYPEGCRFRGRCAFAGPGCESEQPPLTEEGPGHQVACLRLSAVGS
ncbi:MAG: ABC transporter ATP-binding protein [bacterium]